jgi:hypothetical protein
MKKANFLLNKHFKLSDLRVKITFLCNQMLWSEIIMFMQEYLAWLRVCLHVCNFMCDFMCDLRFHVRTVKATADTKSRTKSHLPAICMQIAREIAYEIACVNRHLECAPPYYIFRHIHTFFLWLLWCKWHTSSWYSPNVYLIRYKAAISHTKPSF